VGVPAGTGTALLGAWNIYSATSAQRRAMQQWNEAINEEWSDVTWRNLLGILPFGEKYDDPCEPTPGEFFKEKFKTFEGKVGEILELLREFGTLGG